MYDNRSPSYLVGKFWVNKFKSGHLDVENENRQDLPQDVITEDMVTTVKKFVLSEKTTRTEIVNETSVTNFSAWLTLQLTLEYAKGLDKVDSVPFDTMDES